MPELKTFEKSLKSGVPNVVRSKSGSKSMSSSPKKALLKATKLIQKAVMPAKKRPMITKKRGRKTRI